MSAKRPATTELNHENWDQDDPSEHEEMGTFKAAPKEVLEKRVIRTAKRRAQPSGDEANKSVFSGFGGFNKSQPSSFDFLANLTNGNKDKQEETSKPSTPSNIFGNLAGRNANGGVFGMPMTSTPTKPTFGVPSTQPSVFGASSNAGSSLFSTNTNNAGSSATLMFKGPSNDTKESTVMPTPTATVFGSSSPSSSKPTLPVTEDQPSPFTTQTKSAQANQSENKQSDKDETEEKKKLKYYGKLKGLNESVSDWIKKHVQETPLCILSPIFKDYEKYLKEIQDECFGKEETTKSKETVVIKDSKSNSEDTVKPASDCSSASSLATNTASNTSIFGGKTQGQASAFGGNLTGFNFGIKTEKSSEASSSTGFSFGVNKPSTATISPFSATNTSNVNGTNSFSFGSGQPSNTQPKPENTEANEEDEPPKVEFTPVVEENSVFDKKCKIFVKKDEKTFADKGVGTLYIKKVQGSEKHQLLVRANTTLGNIMLNLILSSEIPTQRLGKNNVMMICIPTPEAKPPPVAVLIRVKTSEEADQLLDTLNKFKA